VLASASEANGLRVRWGVIIYDPHFKLCFITWQVIQKFNPVKEPDDGAYFNLLYNLTGYSKLEFVVVTLLLHCLLSVKVKKIFNTIFALKDVCGHALGFDVSWGDWTDFRDREEWPLSRSLVSDLLGRRHQSSGRGWHRFVQVANGRGVVSEEGKPKALLKRYTLSVKHGVESQLIFADMGYGPQAVTAAPTTVEVEEATNNTESQDWLLRFRNPAIEQQFWVWWKNSKADTAETSFRMFTTSSFTIVQYL
jgi:hypothetical protein